MEIQLKYGASRKKSFTHERNVLNYHTLTNNAVFPHDPELEPNPEPRHFHTKHKSIMEVPKLQPTIRVDKNSVQY